MALIYCPECKKSISDTAETCPHCGFKLPVAAEDFEKKVSQLSAATTRGGGKQIAMIVGGCILIAVGIPLVTIGVGVFLIILGVAALIMSFVAKGKYQVGDCPYCGTNIRVDSRIPSFICPNCKNSGVKTATTLETTHVYEQTENNNQ